MTISVFSVIMSIVCSSIILFAACFLVSHSGRVRWGLIFLILLLGFARLVLPVEIRVAKEIRANRIYPEMMAFSKKEWIAGMTVGDLLLLIWGLGLFVLFLRFLRDVKVIREITARAIPAIKGDRLYDVCEKAMAELGYSGSVRVAVTRELETAVSVGFWAPSILIPKEMLEFDDLELGGVLKHEVTHFLRGDIGKQRLLNFVQCLFWWNPVVHYLKKCMERMMELECDERACQGMDEEARKAYLRAITKVLRMGGGKGPMLGMGYWKNTPASFLKRRFDEVLHPVVRYSNPLTYFLAVVSLLLFCLSYSFIVQPGFWPGEAERSQYSMASYDEERKIPTEFLVKLPDGTYMYISGMLGDKILTESEIQKAPYADLPIYDKGEGD